MELKKHADIYDRLGGNLDFAEIPPKREGNCEEAGVPRAVGKSKYTVP